MKLQSLVASFLISAGLSWAQKPIQLADILSWKRIQAPAVSNDGEWLAYRIAPAEGDAEVVIRNLKTGKELRFPIGDAGAAAPAPDAGGPPQAVPAAMGSALAIAGNSRWAAFQSYPNARDAKKLKKDKKPIQTKVVLVELATGKKTEFDKTRRFAFSGEKATALALHRYPADAAGPPTPPAAATSGGPAADRPSGSDLLLYDLAAGSELNLGNVSEFAFDKKGDWLACLIDARDKAGNGVLLRNMTTGTLQSLDHAEAVYKGLTWTEKGDGLATVRGVDDKGFEDKLYSVVAFKGFGNSASPAKFIFDPKTDKSFPAGMTISPVRSVSWREDLSAVTFGIREVKAKKTPAPRHQGRARVNPRSRYRRRGKAIPRATRSPIWCCGTGRIHACNRSRRCRKTRTRISATSPSGVRATENSCAWPTTACAP